MHGYKKKLLDRYPGKKEDALPVPVPPPAAEDLKPKAKPNRPESETLKSSPNVDSLKQAFDREQAKDETRFRQEAALSREERVKKIAFTAGIPFLAALLGLWAGVAWMDSRLRPNWEHELAELQKQASLKLDRFLSSREIQTLLEDKAKSHGQKTADEEIKKLMNSVVAPAAERIDAGGKKLEAQGAAVLAELKGLSDFMLLELKAKNDDRKAFEELLAVSRDRNHSYRELAAQAVSQVFIQVTSLNIQDPSLGPEKAGQEPSSSYVSFDQFKAGYRDAVSLNRPKLLSEMNASRQFNDAQKTAFLLEVIRGDTSLRAMAWACRLLDEKAKIYKPFTAYEKYLEWGAQKSIRS